MSELLGEPTAIIAERLFDETMLGGPESDESDPVVVLLYWHIRQYMHGVCTSMAMHLSETRGLPVILLETRREGEATWQLRHAAVGSSRDMLPIEEHDEGYRIPILDAAGGGTFADRAELYGLAGWEFRIIYASDTDNAMNRLMASPRRGMMDIEADVLALPGLCQALGIDFNARQAVDWIVDRIRVSPGIGTEVLDAAEAFRILAPTP